MLYCCVSRSPLLLLMIHKASVLYKYTAINPVLHLFTRALSTPTVYSTTHFSLVLRADDRYVRHGHKTPGRDLAYYM